MLQKTKNPKRTKSHERPSFFRQDADAEIYYGFSFSAFFSGLKIIVFGAILARIWCELMIVLFKMNEALQDIRHK